MNIIFDDIQNVEEDFSCTELLNVPIDNIDNNVSEMSHTTNGNSTHFNTSTCIDPEKKLKELLTEWNLEMVHQICLSNLIKYFILI